MFSAAANKGSAAAHPADRERWLDFVIAAHSEGATIPLDALQRWLIEELDWPETVAIELAGSYDNAIEVLRHYDERR